MPDRLSPEARSRVMRAVRKKNTAPEVLLRRALWAAGLRGWRIHRKSLPGSPDLSFGRVKLAIFVDGSFWHGHPSAYRPGRSPFWDKKIASNIERDRRVNRKLRRLGWLPLHVWDFEVERRAAAIVQRIVRHLSRRPESHVSGRPINRGGET